MLQDTPLISTIVVGLVLAFVFGTLANRFRMPPLVGYLLAGVLVGSGVPGFAANAGLASELSEFGVILLMFGVGLNFSLEDLLSVQAVAIPGALGRIAAGTLMGLALGLAMGWPPAGGLLFGLALSVASTVVLLKTLQDRHLIESERGRIAVGWVIVEDIAMVLAVVLIPAFAGFAGAPVAGLHDPFIALIERFSGLELDIFAVLAVTMVKLAAFVGFMLVFGRRLIPAILHFTAHTGSRELFRLAVLVIALGVAAGSAYLFGISLALGAFFAGMILSESELSHRAAQESLPLRDAFAVLFFVSVGMLFDPAILFRNPGPVLATLAIIVVGKSAVAFLILVGFRRTASSALTISVSLAQIGEFSFILAALGTNLGILPPEGRDLILAGAILSIILNPALFWAAGGVRPYLEARFKSRAADLAPASAFRTEPELVGPAAPPPGGAPAVAGPEAEGVVFPTRLTGHTVLIGYGRVGGVVAEGLLAAKLPFVLVEDAEDPVAAAKALGIEVIVGNAASPDVLGLANVAGARAVIIAIPNAFEAGQATEQCRELNPRVRIIARAHSEEEIEHLAHLGADRVIMGEREIGLGMLGWISDASLKGDAMAVPVAGVPPVPETVIASGAGQQPADGPVEAERTEEPVPAEVEAGAAMSGTRADPAPSGPLRVRPMRPTSTAAKPFNPEVAPDAPKRQS